MFRTQAIQYVKWTGFVPADQENYEAYVSEMEDIFRNIHNMPIKQAFEIAEQKGWIYKHYRSVLEFLLS